MPLAAILALIESAPAAEVFPSRPITMVVPFAAGGPTDVIGRVVAEGMRSSLGQPIIIENVTGAAGSIGVGRVARAAPDGYTISIGQWGSHVTTRQFARATICTIHSTADEFPRLELIDNLPGVFGRWLHLATFSSGETQPLSDARVLIAPNKFG